MLSLVSHSVVLSSLHRASRPEGHGLPAEIGFLSWLSFLGNALLLVLQLAKPELDDTESVYVRVFDRDGVVSTNRGWQAFWAGGDAADVAATTWSGHGYDDGGRLRNRSEKRDGFSGCLSRWLGFWCCLGRRAGRDGRRGNEETLEGGGAWPIAGGEAGTSGSLNESLLGSIGLDRSSHRGSMLASGSKARRGWRASGGSDDDEGLQRGCFKRMGGIGTSAPTGNQDMDRDGGELFCPDSFQRRIGAVAGLAEVVGTPSRQRRVRQQAFSSSAYPVVSCTPRAPPQAAAPIFGASVTRWRLVDANGVPLAHGSPSDVGWTDRSTDRSGEASSSRTATLSGSEVATVATSSVFSMIAVDDPDPSASSHEAGEVDVPLTPLKVQFELAVRASGRGEKDWWGRGCAEADTGASVQSANATATLVRGSAAATAAGDWRLWRSAADVLALYDALALRFGQEFCDRVSRPQLKTATTISLTADPNGSHGEASSPTGGGPMSTAPHRADILRDVRMVGAFLRNLLGLRQFLRLAGWGVLLSVLLMSKSQNTGSSVTVGV